MKKYLMSTFCVCFLVSLYTAKTYGQRVSGPETIDQTTRGNNRFNLSLSPVFSWDLIYQSTIVPTSNEYQENVTVFRFTPVGEFIISNYGLEPPKIISSSSDHGEINAVLDVSASHTNDDISARFGYNSFNEYIETMRISRAFVGIGNSSPAHLLEIGKINQATTENKLKVHGGATFNNNVAIKDETDPNYDIKLTTQVSINTNKKIKGAALTVAGPVFIGSWKSLNDFDNAGENDPADEAVNGFINTNHYPNFTGWFQHGVVSEDFAITPALRWRDEVFKEGYQLPTLEEVEIFIQKNKHLKGIPSEKEVKEVGYSVKDLNLGFLEQIEHLVLYTIQQEKKIAAQQKSFTQQQQQMNRMKKDIAFLKATLLMQQK